MLEMLERITLAVNLFTSDAVIRDDNGIPTAIRLLDKGLNKTTKGDLIFDDSSASSVATLAADYGNDFHFDYEHAGFDETNTAPDKTIAAGWYSLEVKPDGLWAVNIDWTPRGYKYLKDKEYKYFSPTLMKNRKTGVVVEYLNTALTNFPARKNLTPLVLSRGAEQQGAADYRTETYSIALDELITSLAGQLASLFPDCWIVEVYNDQIVFRYSRRFWSVFYTIENDLPRLTTDAVEVEKVYVPKTGGTIMKTVLTALGLNTTASEDQATDRASALSAFEREVLALTGKTTIAEATGVLAAYKNANEQVVTLTARVNTLEGEKQTAALNALIQRGVDEKKLTPAMAEWAKTQSLETLNAFLEVAAPNQVLSTPNHVEPTTGTGGSEPMKYDGKTWTEMKPMEKHRLADSNEALYNAMFAEHQASKNK